MAIYTNTSQTKTTANTPVYTLGDNVTLMVGPAAALATTNSNSPVVKGQENATISLAGDFFAGESAGIVTDGDGANVRITAKGSITAKLEAIDLAGSGNEVTNAGTVLSETTAIALGAAGSTGYAGGMLVNSGFISGFVGLEAYGTTRISNSGTIEGAGRLYGGAVVFGGAISIEGGADIVNSGSIVGLLGYGIKAGSGGHQVLVRNTGLIAAEPGNLAIETGGGDDRVVNAGTILGSVVLWSGDDLYDGTRGLIDGPVRAGNGADTLLGGAAGEWFDGGEGEDELAGGGGNDTLIGGAGADLLEGGEGFDVLSYAGAAAITLDLASEEGRGGDAEGDQFGGFEAYVGSSAGDTMYGAGGNDVFFGGNGNDSLSASSGNDRLSGQAGLDTLIGGAGRDTLRGGVGADQFRYLTVSESTPGAAGRDRILDFSHAEGDLIHLWSIDANTAQAGNQTFGFLGTGAFTGVAGQLRCQVIGGSTFVYGDVNGDATADLVIQLVGVHALVAADFVL